MGSTRRYDADGNERYLLINAINLGQVDVVRALLAAGAPPKYHRKHSPLFYAARGGNLEIVQVLVGYGADVHSSKRILNAAASNGHLEVVKFLLEQGAVMEASRHHHPITGACKNGHLEVVKFLFGREKHLETELGPQTFLVATFYGQLEIVKFYLDSGINVDAVDGSGFSALHVAAQAGHLELARLLLDRGASIELVKGKRKTPLYCAAKKGHLDVLKLLVERGAVRAAGRGLIESLRADRLDIAELLIHKRPQLANEEPKAIVEAVKSIHRESEAFLQLLIDLGADVNWLCEKKVTRTALHYAVVSKQSSKVWRLMLHGADTAVPYVKAGMTKTVWELCEGDKATHTALLHFWTPHSHHLYPRHIKDVVICVLLVARQQRWPFDGALMTRILSHIAYDWQKSKKHQKWNEL